MLPAHLVKAAHVIKFNLLALNPVVGLVLGHHHPCQQPVENVSYYRVSFLTGPAQKVLSIRLHSKFHQKSSKCQKFLTDWHLDISGRDHSKKTPCIFYDFPVQYDQYLF